MHKVFKMSFYNSRDKNMNIFDVIEKIKKFISSSPKNTYRLAIGTDSQVITNKIVFVTSIHIHRIGKGCWGCISKNIMNSKLPRRRKIRKETTLTKQVVIFFLELVIDDLYKCLIEHDRKVGDLIFEAHIDVGKDGDTQILISEMLRYFSGLDVTTQIKPDSYAASAYSNRYTKNKNIS